MAQEVRRLVTGKPACLTAVMTWGFVSAHGRCFLLGYSRAVADITKIVCLSSQGIHVLF